MQVQRVQKLYYNSLKAERSWSFCPDPNVFVARARLIRARFEAHRNEKDPAVIERLLTEGEAELDYNLHPTPYLWPTQPGGTLYERNKPPPIELTRPEAHVVMEPREEVPGVWQMLDPWEPRTYEESLKKARQLAAREPQA